MRLLAELTAVHETDAITPCLETSPQRLAACSTERARALVPLEVALSVGVLPIAVVEHSGTTILAAAVRRGENVSVAKALTFRLGASSRLVEVDANLLDEAITIAYKGDGSALSAAADRLPEPAPEQDGGKVLWMPAHAGAAQLFAELLEHGQARGASDIVIVPRTDDCEIRYKINGEIHRWNGKKISRAVHQQLVRRAKVLARLDPTVTTIPQDGSFEGARGLRARLSTLPTIHGENIVVRLVTGRVRTIEELGFSITVRERINQWLGIGHGLAIFSGPTGAGKSASLYACIRELVRRGAGVATVEDPVEIEIADAIQTQVSTELAFSQTVRAVLRQAPDVIAVGEVRDSDTAKALIEAATTGHLVLCSIHGGTVHEVLARFAHFGVSVSVLAMVLRGIVVQRLLPTLCSHCRVIDLATGGYREVGCAQCYYTGYEGRVLIAESYSQPPRGVNGIECVEPHFQGWDADLVRLRQEGVISQRSAALVRW